MQKDFYGREIMPGDTIILAILWGRSAALGERIVLEVLEDGLIIEGTDNNQNDWRGKTRKAKMTYTERCVIIKMASERVGAGGSQ